MTRMRERSSRSGIGIVAVLLGLVFAAALEGQAVDPPAANPAPISAPVPAGPPASPQVPPPAEGPLPAADAATPTTNPQAPATRNATETGGLEPRVSPAATEPGQGDISEAPIQQVPVPYLPKLSAWEHQLEAYRAAIKGELVTALEHYEQALVGEPDNLRWGAEYRQVLIAARQGGRGEKFLEKLARDNPGAANLQLNLGYFYVDQMPGSGPLAALGLAGRAQRAFSRSIEIDPSWLAFYTRGSSYVFWPPMMNKTLLGIADLEKAIELAGLERRQKYHSLAWTALGDGFWRLGQRLEMRATWRRGLELYPHAAELEKRLSFEDRELDDFLAGIYRPGQRIDTRLEEIWQAMREEAP